VDDVDLGELVSGLDSGFKSVRDKDFFSYERLQFLGLMTLTSFG
jgi:hypothetical protein